MSKIVENVTIYFTSGERECFDAITFRKKGVCTGIIVNNSNTIKFTEQRYIPLNQIKKIIIINETGEVKNIDF